MTFIGEVEHIGEEIVQGVEAPFKLAAKVEKFLSVGLKDEPALKAVIVGLVQRFETVTADGAKDIAADGLNLPGDVQTFADIEALFGYYKTDAKPAFAKAWTDFETAVATAQVVPAAQAVSTAGPGLHTVVAA